MYTREEIIRGCLKGKRKFQNILYDEFCDMVMGISYRYGKDQGDADDIFQESFLKVFRNLSRLNDPLLLPGWIKTIAINTALDFVKKNGKISFDEVETIELSSNDYEIVLDQLNTDELVKLINSLPLGYKTVFNMYINDGYSHKEIAASLEISENTSKSQLRCAKALLKNKLAKIGISKYESAS